MQIRKKLTFQFIAIVALLLLVSSIAIYYFSADYRKDDFYSRLRNKATNTAKLLIEVEEVDAELLRKIEKDNPTGLNKEKISIYNYKNELLYSSEQNNYFQIDRKWFDEIRIDEEIRYKIRNYEILGFLFTDKYDRFVVIIGAEDIYGLKKLKNLRTVLFVVFTVSILFVFVSGWIYAGRTLKPISKVIQQVDNITITSLNLRVDEGKSKDEIATLAATFNKMLDRLEKSFNVQKNFIANASHELRTPLTSITGQLEVILMNDRSAVEYKQSMISILEDMRNLTDISNRLLMLAQASSESTETSFKPVRIDEVILQSASELKKRNPDYKIHVSLDDSLDSEQKLTIKGNDQLIKTAFVNLMDNGCKYSDDHKIEVSVLSEQRNIVLLFCDHGIGINRSDLPNIFQPFHRGSNAITYKGHGVGLSLVERIMHIHHGSISVDSEIDKGTTFKVILPYLIF